MACCRVGSTECSSTYMGSFEGGQGQGQQPRVPDCDGAGTAERNYPESEVRGGDERSYLVSEVRGGSREELPHAPSLRPGAAGGRSYPTPEAGAVAGRTNPTSEEPWLCGRRRA